MRVYRISQRFVFQPRELVAKLQIDTGRNTHSHISRQRCFVDVFLMRPTMLCAYAKDVATRFVGQANIVQGMGLHVG